MEDRARSGILMTWSWEPHSLGAAVTTGGCPGSTEAAGVRRGAGYPSRGGESPDLVEGLLQIGPDVIGVLDADRDPYRARTEPGGGQRGLVQHPV